MKYNKKNIISIFVIFLILGLCKNDDNGIIGKCLYLKSESTLINFYNLRSLGEENK